MRTYFEDHLERIGSPQHSHRGGAALPTKGGSSSSSIPRPFSQLGGNYSPAWQPTSASQSRSPYAMKNRTFMTSSSVSPAWTDTVLAPSVASFCEMPSTCEPC